MEIEIDYYTFNKVSGKRIELKHCVLDDEDILELAKEKVKNENYLTEYEFKDFSISKTVID